MTISNEHKWMALSIMCIIVQMVCRDNMLYVCLRSIRRLWGAWTWTIDLYVGQECLWPYIRQWQPFSSRMPHVRSLLRMTRHSIHPWSGRYAIQMAVLWTSFQKVMTVSNFTNIGNKFRRIIRNWFCTLHPVRASASISFGCFCNVMSRHARIKLENLGHYAQGCHEWYHFRWPWVIPISGFKVTTFLKPNIQPICDRDAWRRLLRISWASCSQQYTLSEIQGSWRTAFWKSKTK